MVKKVKFQQHTPTRHATPYCHSRPENGQGLVEYMLIIVLLSLIGLVGLSAMGVNLGEVFNKIVNSIGLSAGPQEEQPIEENTSLQVRVVNPANEGVSGVQVYVYQNGKTYNDLSGTTDSNGETYFELEAGIVQLHGILPARVLHLRRVHRPGQHTRRHPGQSKRFPGQSGY